jgi:chaperonin GroEL
VVVKKILDSKDDKFGFDADKEKYGDMMQFGIVDPTKVARCALQNASSIAGLLLTTETLVTEVKEKKKDAPMGHPHGGGMGGMGGMGGGMF